MRYVDYIGLMIDAGRWHCATPPFLPFLCDLIPYLVHHDVGMTHSDQRHVDTHHGAKVGTPHSAAVDDGVGFDVSLRRGHTCDLWFTGRRRGLCIDCGHPTVLEDLCDGPWRAIEPMVVSFT